MTVPRRRVAFGDLAPALERIAVAALSLLSLTAALELVRPLVNRGGVALTNVEAVLLLTIGLWLLACAAARRRPQVPRALGLAVVTWLAVVLASALAAPSHRTEAIKFCGRMVSGVLAGWAAYDLAQRSRQWRLLVRALALGGLAVAVLGLAEAGNVPLVVRFLAGFKHAPTVAGDVLRVSSTLVYATVASMVLELTVPLILAWVLTAQRRPAQALLGIGLIAALAAQVLTLTRTGVVALLAALGLIGVWAAWHRQRPMLVGSLATGGASLALVAIVLVGNPLAKLRLASETERLWYQAAYGAPVHLVAEAGADLKVPLTLTNTGVRAWQTTGPYPFQLGYHLTQPDGSVVDFDGARTLLPRDVPPGASVEVMASLAAPPAAGEYVVQWEMLQEDVTWFSWKGTSPARTNVTVLGAAAADQEPLAPPEPQLTPPTTSAPQAAPGRLELWQTAASLVRARPLLGIGPDNFRWTYGAHAGLDRWDNRVHSNSLYVEWLVGTGLLGFLAFLWLSLLLVQTVYRRLQEARFPQGSRALAELTVWRLALAGSLIAWFVHGILDSFFEFTPTYLAFWLAAGLAACPIPQREG